MLKPIRSLTIATAALMAVVMLATLTSGVQAQSSPAPNAESRANVLLKFHIYALEGDKRVPVKVYNLIVAEGPVGSKLLAGERVPFPMHMDDDDGDDSQKIVYQNVGFTTEVKVWITGDKQITMVADLENSQVVRPEDGGPPSVITRQLSVNAILTDGVPLELTRTEGITENAGTVEVLAEIQR